MSSRLVLMPWHFVMLFHVIMPWPFLMSRHVCRHAATGHHVMTCHALSSYLACHQSRAGSCIMAQEHQSRAGFEIQLGSWMFSEIPDLAQDPRPARVTDRVQYPSIQVHPGEFVITCHGMLTCYNAMTCHGMMTCYNMMTCYGMMTRPDRMT